MPDLNYLLRCHECGQKLEPLALKCPHCGSQKTVRIRFLLILAISLVLIFLFFKHSSSSSSYNNQIRENISLKYTTNSLIFGTSLTPDFTIKNLNAFAVKNIIIQCEELTANGSIIDRMKNTITGVILPQETKIFKTMDMGTTIDNQTASVSCTIFSAEMAAPQ